MCISICIYVFMSPCMHGSAYAPAPPVWSCLCVLFGLLSGVAGPCFYRVRLPREGLAASRSWDVVWLGLISTLWVSLGLFRSLWVSLGRVGVRRFWVVRGVQVGFVLAWKCLATGDSRTLISHRRTPPPLQRPPFLSPLSPLPPLLPDSARNQ